MLLTRVYVSIKGIPRSFTCEGYNKKLATLESEVLKNYLYMCYSIDRKASIDNAQAAANSILRLQRLACYSLSPIDKGITYARVLIAQNITIEANRSKGPRRTREGQYIKAHFKKFKRYKEHWHILNKDIYNFDKTGYIINKVFRSEVLIFVNFETVCIDDLTNQELVTAVECIFIGGYHDSFTIIFKRAFHLRKLFKKTIQKVIFFKDTQFLALQMIS